MLNFEEAIETVSLRIPTNAEFSEFGHYVLSLLWYRLPIVHHEMENGTIVNIEVVDEYNKYIFYTDLSDAVDVNEAVNLIATSPYDLSKDDQPDLIIHHVQHLADSVEDAALFAEVIKKRLDDIVICRDSSTRLDFFATLLDCISMHVDMFADGDRYFYFRLAFTNAGFKRSRDCSTQMLRSLFFLDIEYFYLTSDDVLYDYDEIKRESKVRPHELMPFLCRPSFVGRWVATNGTNVENYLE